MSAKLYEVFVSFHALNHLSGPMKKMAQEMGYLDKQTEALQKRLTGFKNMMWAGAGITAFGVGIAAGLKHAVDAAGELQLSLMGVKQKLGLTAKEFHDLQNIAQIAGLPTIFTAAQTGDIIHAMVKSGLGRRVLDPEILKQYMSFADVRTISAHENAPEAVSEAVNMAHLFSVYGPKESERFLNTLNAALSSYHGSTGEFATQFGYFAKQANAIGMTAEDAVAAEAWLGRMGMGRMRGGTNFNQFLTRILPHISNVHPKEDAAHVAAMQDAGFLDAQGGSVFLKNGKFVGMEKTLQIMQGFAKRMGGDVTRMSTVLKDLFGEQGKRAALAMVSHGSLEQWHDLIKQMNQVASVTKQQDEYWKTWDGQVKHFGTVLHDLLIQLGMALLPTALKFLKVVNKTLVHLLEWAMANPELVKMAANWAAVAAAVALVVGPIMVVRGALGYLFASGLIASGVKMFGAALLGTLPTLGMLAAATAVVYATTIRNNKDLVHVTKNGGENMGKAWFQANERLRKLGKDMRLMMHVASGEDINVNAFWQALAESANEARRNIYASFQWLADNIPKALEAVSRAVQSIGKFFQRWADDLGKVVQHLRDIGLLGGANSKVLSDIQTYAARGPSAPVPVSPSTDPARFQGTLRANTQPGWVQKLNHLFGYASGTDYAWGGLSLVGERGPELVDLPRGSRVIPNDRMGDALGGINVAAGAITIYQQPGQSPQELARCVIRELGVLARNRSYASPDAVLPAWGV